MTCDRLRQFGTLLRLPSKIGTGFAAKLATEAMLTNSEDCGENLNYSYFNRAYKGGNPTLMRFFSGLAPNS